jgi:Tfp pilus assembly protein PilZ
MPEDRRSARRARLSGVRVTYEGATGQVHEAEVADLSREGVFIVSAHPTTVGKRLSLDIQVAGEAASWPALGRVIWVRPRDEGDDLPAGMAVKIIDVEEAIAVAIDRLIEARERTDPGLGGAETAPPAREKPLRERTMIGVGIPVSPAPATPAGPLADASAPVASAPRAEAPSPAARAAPVLPSREKTMLGVGLGAAGADPREPSVAIDLVAKKPPSTRPPAELDDPDSANVPATRLARDSREAEKVADARVREFEKVAGPADEGASEAPAPGARSGVGWLLLMVLVAASAAGAYVFRDRVLPVWHSVLTEIMNRLR